MYEIKEFEEGSIIGNYRVVRPLGQGGMGTVYEVAHLELATHYALKTFSFDPNHEAASALKKKFLEEGMLLARLKHPNLTHVFDLGFEEETGTPYFVMDLITYEDGYTYTVEDIDLKDIDEDMVYGWFKQLASALDYIHAEGIVHRDIKPSNLLVDKDLNVILTDFGVSHIFGNKIKSEVHATRTMATKTGRGKLILGSDHYIAPEVKKGGKATLQTDAYSLGVMLLRWLTGFYYDDNPGAINLLPNKKYKWISVIPQLLAPFGRRPENYTELLKLLKPAPKPAPSVKPPASKLPEKKPNKAKGGILKTISTIAAVGILSVGGYFAWNAYQKAEAEKRKHEALAKQQQVQMQEMQKQLAEVKAEVKTETSVVVTNTVVKVIEQNQDPVVIPPPVIMKDAEKVSKIAIEPVEIEQPPEENIEQTVRPKEKLGPIPNVKYTWEKNGPMPVQFLLANGSKLDLLPNNKGIFYMSNMNNNGAQIDQKEYHKVRFTYNFWISKFWVTTEQWREFAPFDCEDSRELEKAIGGEYPVVKKFPFHSITSYCGYLTRKYKSQLPDGYVFRLPTEAELEYASTGKFGLSDLLAKGDKDKYRTSGPSGDVRMEKLKKNKHLDKLGKWRPSESSLEGTVFMISGLADSFPTGIYDCWDGWNNPVIDRLKWYDVPNNYADEEVDPLHWTEEDYNGNYIRTWEKVRQYKGDNELFAFHIVVGPNVDKLNKYDETFVKSIKYQSKKVLEQKYNFSIPKKVSRPRELKFELANGVNMVFNACPAGKFLMSNISGQEKNFHKVVITKPFWMTKFNIRIEEWEDYAPNDYPGIYKLIQKAFHKYPVSVFKSRKQWMAYCNYLNATYGHLLPQGYIFRLPSEAEWEYAFLAGEGRNSIRFDDVGTHYQRCKEQFSKMLKKRQDISILGNWNSDGRFSRIYVGGRAKAHKWGFYNMHLDAAQMTLDTFCYESKNWAGDATEHIIYEDKMVDPLFWAGDIANRGIVRQNFNARWNVGNGFQALAHIVIGPDLVKECEAKQSDQVQNKGLPTEKLPPLRAELNVKPVKAGYVTIPKGEHMTISLPNGEKLQFVKCKKGSFKMGYEENEDIFLCHRVTISRDYWIAQYPLTKAQWKGLMEFGNKDAESSEGDIDWKNKMVHTDQHQCLLNSLSALQISGIPDGYIVRYPSEAEWEYALKGSKKNDYWKFKFDAKELERMESDINAPVGKKRPNSRGIYDFFKGGSPHACEFLLDTFNPRDASLIEVGQWGALNRIAYKKTPVTDPLFHFEGNGSVRLSRRCRSAEHSKQIGGFNRSVRLCIGPDLVAEIKAKK